MLKERYYLHYRTLGSTHWEDYFENYPLFQYAEHTALHFLWTREWTQARVVKRIYEPHTVRTG